MTLTEGQGREMLNATTVINLDIMPEIAKQRHMLVGIRKVTQITQPRSL